jgi:hypothetical protein
MPGTQSCVKWEEATDCALDMLGNVLFDGELGHGLLGFKVLVSVMRALICVSPAIGSQVFSRTYQLQLSLLAYHRSVFVDFAGERVSRAIRTVRRAGSAA